MAELIAAVVSWPSLLLVLVVFGFAPGFCLRLIVLVYPRDDPRRAELIAELYAVPRIQRPLWVAEQLEVALFEDFAHRVSVVLRARARGVRVRTLLQIGLACGLAGGLAFGLGVGFGVEPAVMVLDLNQIVNALGWGWPVVGGLTGGLAFGLVGVFTFGLMTVGIRNDKPDGSGSEPECHNPQGAGPGRAVRP